MSEFISLGKALVNAFAKQVSLNALLLSCSLTLFVVAYWDTNRTCMYIGCCLFLFTVLNWIFKNYQKYKNRWLKRRFESKMKNPKKQRAFLESLDSSEIELLSELFYLYPDAKFLSFSNAAVVSLNRRHCLLYVDGLVLANRYGFPGYCCSLQPWVKHCIDNNTDWRRKVLKKHCVRQ